MSNSSAADGRRSSRISLSLPIVIHGKDAQQKAFRESTHTLIVNRHGAKFLTSQRLVIGAEVLVENPTLGSVARANVVWISAKRNQDGLQEAGVQLVESQNIWGLEFPPDDWTPNGKDLGAPAAKEAPAPRPVPAESVPAQTPPPALTSEEIATQFLQELHETSDAHARRFRQRLDQVMQQVGLQLEIDLRERAATAIAQELATMEEDMLSSSQRLSALKGEFQELDARLTEYQVSLGVALERAPLPLTPEQIYEKMQAEALPALNLITESGIASARERIQAQVQADAGQALTAWSNNLHAERDSLLDEARQQIMAVVSSALETLHQERDAGLKQMKRCLQEEIQENKERVVLQIKSKLDETAESHGESLVARLNETARETGERQANVLQTHLDALLASRLDEAQQHALSVGESLQNNLEDGLRAAGEKRSQELQARLQEIADKTVASSSDQIRAQVEESANAVAEKSLQSWQTWLQEIAHKTVTSSSDQIRVQVEESANAAAEKGVQSWQTRLQEIADKAVASSSDQIQKQVQESAHAAAEKSLHAWQARLQEVADRTAASSSDQVKGQINEALSFMGPKLQEMQERAVNEAVEALRGRLSQLLGLLQPGGNK